jgi:hypothetical protein
VAAIVEIAGIAGMYPAVGCLGVVGRLGVLEILLEHAGAAIEHLSGVGNPEFDLGNRFADGIGIDLAIGMDGDEDRGLGLSIDCFMFGARKKLKISGPTASPAV